MKIIDLAYQYYIENKAEFAKNYNGKYIVIVGERVVGVYDNEEEAYHETTKTNSVGTFLIQECSEDESRSIIVMSSNTEQYMPGFVTTLGETLAEILDERNITQTELAERTGWSRKTIDGIIQARVWLLHKKIEEFPKLLAIDEVLKLVDKLQINLQLLLRYRLNIEVLVGKLYKDINFSEILKIREHYVELFGEHDYWG